MNSAPLIPLAMSQTKDDLLKHLNMGLDTYSLMAKEADRVYKWLTSDTRHLKKNCKRKPPYDWSDILEASKDEAMTRIAQSSDAHTRYYWNLAVPTEDCPNWIARWFLYHKFRYRDGRNRSLGKDGKPVSRRSGAGGSKDLARGANSTPIEQSYDGRGQSYPASYYPNMESSTSDIGISSSYSYAPTGSSSSNSTLTTYSSTSYSTTQTYAYGQAEEATGNNDTAETTTPYYDPVRDV